MSTSFGGTKPAARGYCTTRVFFTVTSLTTAAVTAVAYLKGVSQHHLVLIVSVSTLFATLAIFARIVQLAVVKDPIEDLARSVEWEELSFPAHKLKVSTVLGPAAPPAGSAVTGNGSDKAGKHGGSGTQVANTSSGNVGHPNESQLTTTELGLLRALLQLGIAAQSGNSASAFKTLIEEKRMSRQLVAEGDTSTTGKHTVGPKWSLKQISKNGPADFTNTVLIKSSISYEEVTGYFTDRSPVIKRNGKQPQHLLRPNITWRDVAVTFNDLLAKCRQLRGDPRLIFTLPACATAVSDGPDPSLSTTGRRDAYEHANEYAEELEFGMPVGMFLVAPTRQSLETAKLVLGAALSEAPVVAHPLLAPRGFVVTDVDALVDEYPQVNFDLVHGMEYKALETDPEHYARMVNATASFWLFGSGVITVIADRYVSNRIGMACLIFHSFAPPGSHTSLLSSPLRLSLLAQLLDASKPNWVNLTQIVLHCSASWSFGGCMTK